MKSECSECASGPGDGGKKMVRSALALSVSAVLLASTGCQTGLSKKSVPTEETPPESGTEFMVVSAEDSGPGTLRQAIADANESPGIDSIRFDARGGVFGPPLAIVLESELPEITEGLSIDGFLDGYLWQAAGIILDGNGRYRILSVAPGVEAEVRNLTLANGSAKMGGAILNRGSLVVSGVTFQGNSATSNGGALFNDKGQVQLINSTIVANEAGSKGGGVYNRRGSMTVTNCTFTENNSRKGGAVYDTGELLLRNSILANSDSKQDCYSSGQGDPLSTHNIVEVNSSCPGVLHEADPTLDELNFYNGMTQTISLGMRSLASNAGSNGAAVDEHGETLRWDQRGNGDPRFVAGYTDIGAFETQVYPNLVVDTVEDNHQRACGGASGDCPLRAAVRLADASQRDKTITFDKHVFKNTRILELEDPIAVPATAIIIDGRDVEGLVIKVRDGRPLFGGALPDNIQIRNLELQDEATGY